MSENPLVSIVIPVYKSEDYIENSINSVLRQTYDNIELIIVNDGSPDASIEVAKRILKDYEQKYTIIDQRNAGLGAARNTGICEASGEWICFLDSDDMMADNAIEHLVSVAQKNKADIVFSKYNEITSSDEAVRIVEDGGTICFSEQEIQEAFLKRTFVILAPGTLYRKDLLIENKILFERIPWSEDQHFIWRVLLTAKKIVFVNEPMYQYLRRPGSIMDSTKITAMIESYHYYGEIEKAYSGNKQISKYIVPRWVMGTLNSATVMVKYDEWKKLAQALNIRKSFITLLTFPDKRVVVMALLGVCSPKIFYYVNRKRKGSKVLRRA